MRSCRYIEPHPDQRLAHWLPAGDLDRQRLICVDHAHLRTAVCRAWAACCALTRCGTLADLPTL